MKKTLKSIQKKYGMLNESYAWERTPGKALPTLKDVQAKHNAKSVNEQGNQSLNEAPSIDVGSWSDENADAAWERVKMSREKQFKYLHDKTAEGIFALRNKIKNYYARDPQSVD